LLLDVKEDFLLLKYILLWLGGKSDAKMHVCSMAIKFKDCITSE